MWVNPSLSAGPSKASASLRSVSNVNGFGDYLNALMVFQRDVTNRPTAQFNGFRVAANTNASAAFASLNITTASVACVAPTAQGSSLTFSNVTGNAMTGSFTAASPASDNYLVVRTTGSTPSAPMNGTAYAAGVSALGGVIVSAGSSVTFTSSSLSSNTTYRYVVYSYNNSNCTGGPLYNVASPLDGSRATTNTIPLFRKLTIVGSSTSACTGPANGDSCYVNRIINYYASIGNPITYENLAIGGTDPFQADMTRAIQGSNGNNPPGVILINYPSNGYCTYTVAQVMERFRLMKKQANVAGIPCYITTTQPREEGCFLSDAIQLKMTQIKDSVLLQFGSYGIDFYTTIADPADSTIANQFANSDGIHLNNAGHRILFERVLAKDIFNTVLPLKFLGFTAVGRETENQLTWKTAEESNPARFEVQRSTNGIDFSTIANIASGNSNSTASYNYTDRSATGTINYYRIAAKDKDGKIAYTNILSVKSASVFKLGNIYTNGQSLTVEIQSPLRQNAGIQLITVSGQVVLSTNIKLSNGLNTVPLPKPAAGIYLIKVNASEGAIIKKTFIQ